MLKYIITYMPKDGDNEIIETFEDTDTKRAINACKERFLDLKKKKLFMYAIIQRHQTIKLDETHTHKDSIVIGNYFL